MAVRILAGILITVVLLTSVMENAQAQWYLGAGAGRTSMEAQQLNWDYPDIQTEYNIDFNDTSYTIFGGWKSTRGLALEVGYIDLGKYSDEFFQQGYYETLETKVNALFSGLAGNVDLGYGWNFPGKLGLAYWQTDIKYRNNTPFSDSSRAFGFDPVLGLGFEYNYDLGATKKGIRFEWEQFQNVEKGAKVHISPQRSVSFNG
jgi:hypothetical protein